MFGLFLRFHIFLVEKLGLGMLRGILGLVDIEEVVEIDIRVFDRQVLVDQRLGTGPQLFLVCISQLQVVLAVEIYVHSVSIVII